LAQARAQISGNPQSGCISMRSIYLQWCYHATCAWSDNINPIFAENISIRKIPGFAKLRQKLILLLTFAEFHVFRASSRMNVRSKQRGFRTTTGFSCWAQDWRSE